MVRLNTLSALVFAAISSAVYIVPAGHWRDTNGNLVNAHAGGVIFDQPSNKYWLFGEYKIEGQTEGGGVRVYSSEDLATWEDHGLALNAPNRAYNWLLQGHAVSDTIEGPYTYVDAYRPLGNWSQDFGLFTDPGTNRSYALYSNGDRREARDVYLTSYNEDVTGLEETIYRWDKFDLEAPSIVKTDAGYFAIMSHKTGYRPNNVVAFRADKLEGPWSQPWIINPLNTRGLNSQSGNTLTIHGSEQTTHLYMGDRWDLNANWEATYVWLPLIVDPEKKSIRIDWVDVYDLDVKTGLWSIVQGQTYYSADATLTGDAWHQEAPFASNGTIATGIDGDDSTISFEIQGEGGEQWVSVYYQNIDDLGFGDSPFGAPDRLNGKWILRRYGWVEINNEPSSRQQISMKDTHKGIIMATPVAVHLTAGINTLTIGGMSNGNGTKAGDVDKIIVYPLEKKGEGCRL
ncbi:hypothetical protein NW754_011317 [Fusarium falciforme]|nr:hypothetical protein NW754_011317 [Fusarium falciforme]